MKPNVHFVSQKGLKKIAAQALERIISPRRSGGARIVFLSGNLGAGKTTFAQVFARLIGASGRVLSPTFVFAHEHALAGSGYPFLKLVHIDAYRIEDKKMFEATRLAEYFKDSKNLILLEWGEKIERWIPRPDLKIIFAHHKPTLRRISFT